MKGYISSLNCNHFLQSFPHFKAYKANTSKVQYNIILEFF